MERLVHAATSPTRLCGGLVCVKYKAFSAWREVTAKVLSMRVRMLTTTQELGSQKREDDHEW